MIAIVAMFVVLGGAGFLTFNAATEYTGSSQDVCQRDSEGDQTCSNPGRTVAEVFVFFGLSSDDAIVTSEALLNTSRVLFAALLLSIAAAAMYAQTNSKSDAAP